VILLGIVLVVVAHLLHSAARPVSDPPARMFCHVCGARFGGASALGHHMAMSHPPEDEGQVVSKPQQDGHRSTGA